LCASRRHPGTSAASTCLVPRPAPGCPRRRHRRPTGRVPPDRSIPAPLVGARPFWCVWGLAVLVFAGSFRQGSPDPDPGFAPKISPLDRQAAPVPPLPPFWASSTWPFFLNLLKQPSKILLKILAAIFSPS